MDEIARKVNSMYENDAAKSNIDMSMLGKLGLKDITLRDYQIGGVNWLVERYNNHHGCILGDEMGLGKTCQTISFLVYLNSKKSSKGPHLILSPLSVLNNWQSELERFAPGLCVISYVGNKDDRPEIQNTIKRVPNKHCVVLTTYELCLKDESFLRRIQWHTLVVDEAHRLKNRESLLHVALKDFQFEHRVLLTGTPVQNNMAELYSLLNFVAPKMFRGKYREGFVERYSDSENKKLMDELHQLLSPMLLRRVKSEVLKDIPQKSEVVLYHGMSKLQKKYYKAILTKDLDAFETGPNQTKTRLMNILMQLRKCVNHPYLFDGVEPEPFQLGDHLIEASGKLTLIDQLLKLCKSQGHKVLMFSQMTHMLDVIQDYLGYKGYLYERLDGSVRGEERYLAIKNFNKEEDTFIFLLSTRAGGQGLNLVAADTVIFIDSDFNPQNDLQAAARAHRIGQTRPVKIIRLIARNTVEEIILKRAEAKLKLTNTVIEGGHFAHGTVDKADMITDEDIKLQDILKFGVDSLLSCEDSSIEDVDFKVILGPSVDGEWGLEETPESIPEKPESIPDIAAMDTGGSMYMFEGTDYSKEPSAEDKKAFDVLIETERALIEDDIEEAATSRASRRKIPQRLMLGVDDFPRERKKLTPEELEQRKLKRVETMARRAKEAEEAAARKAEEKRKRKEAKWKATGYISRNITLASDGESEDEEELSSSGGDGRAINYVSGDVTHPQDDVTMNRIIVHCVDDSGGWGRGGVFTAISNRSKAPENQYELAGDMKDLSLGDAHLVEIEDGDQSNKTDYLAMLVAQTRDRKNNLSGIKLGALSQGLQKIYRAAKEKKGSVHLPRIGYNTPGFNWYGTERLIRKHLAAKGIKTYIYYYPRRRAQKQPPKRPLAPDSDSEDNTPAAKRTHSNNSANPSTSKHDVSDTESEGENTTAKTKLNKTPSTSKHDISASESEDENPSSKRPLAKTTSAANHHMSDSSDNESQPLPDFMSEVSVLFHKISPTDSQLMSRYLVAYDGTTHTSLQDDTTHVIVNNNSSVDKEIEDMMSKNESVEVVKLQWLKDCFNKQTRVSTAKYRLTE